MRHVNNIVTNFIGCFVEGWMLMLFIGGLHHEISSAIPPIGYWTAFVLSLPLGALMASYQTVQNVQTDQIHQRIVGD